MKTHTIEAQSDSLDTARIEVRKKLPAGHVVIEETILDDGLSKTVEAEASSVDDAVRKAKARVPGDATIEKQDVLRQPSREVREIVAFDEGEARQKVGVSRPQTIESISVKHAGRAGLLGFGRRPSTFAVVVIKPASVLIAYRPLASIRAKAGTAEMIPSMKEVLWEQGGPIRREGLYEEQRSAVLGLSVFARAGNATAVAEIESLITKAARTLLDIGEFSSYHGYQRQQVAAEILGLVGSAEQIKTLESGLRLQEAHAGCSQYSNRTNTQRLVEAAIEQAIGNLRLLGGAP